ncbi:MAG: L-aspartate oxidase [Clostridia bacterium]|nr:L-aspartate oxidase [Clostridia bacterium]
MKTDVLIVGSGCAGLYCALKLPRDKKITIITKGALRDCDSYLAQGGICVLRDEGDYDAFFEDTMRAGHYENDTTSVELMIKNSRAVIDDLISYGVEFAREEDGSLAYTREGAHSNHRILYYQDITGKAITEGLICAVSKLDNVTILEYVTLLDIIERDGECFGGVIRRKDGTLDIIESDFTVLATGGIGGLFAHSTNFPHLTGDALAIALKHKIRLKDINYIQIHPTTLYVEGQSGRSFLISESVRGEGALLYNKNMERFTNELLPRDKLTEAIFHQMALDGTEFVWEDLRTIPRDELLSHFPNIIEACRRAGYDPLNECIPVVPAQHYFMGGIWVDHNSKSSMERLWAIGETACNGVHGKNRLASNSLLESLVFASLASNDIRTSKMGEGVFDFSSICLDLYEDETIEAEYKKIVLDEIERVNNINK